MTSFSSTAFSTNACSITAWDFGGSPPSPSPAPVRDTHDGWIPDHIVRKFYEDERLKYSKVIKTYKNILKSEVPEEVRQLKQIVSEYASNTSSLKRDVLNEIADDKMALARFLTAIDTIESRLVKYQAELTENRAEEELLLIIASIV